MELSSSIVIWRKSLQQLDKHNENGFQFNTIAAIGKKCYQRNFSVFILQRSKVFFQAIFCSSKFKSVSNVPSNNYEMCKCWLIHVNAKLLWKVAFLKWKLIIGMLILKTLIEKWCHQMKINNWNVNTKNSYWKVMSSNEN